MLGFQVFTSCEIPLMIIEIILTLLQMQNRKKIQPAFKVCLHYPNIHCMGFISQHLQNDGGSSLAQLCCHAASLPCTHQRLMVITERNQATALCSTWLLPKAIIWMQQHQEELASLGVTMNEFMPKWPFNFIIQEKKKCACNCNLLVLLRTSVLGQECLHKEAQPEEP